MQARPQLQYPEYFAASLPKVAPCKAAPRAWDFVTKRFLPPGAVATELKNHKTDGSEECPPLPKILPL
jgi:hypothetical protein